MVRPLLEPLESIDIICGRTNLSRNSLFRNFFIDLKDVENSASAPEGLWQPSHYNITELNRETAMVSHICCHMNKMFRYNLKVTPEIDAAFYFDLAIR